MAGLLGRKLGMTQVFSPDGTLLMLRTVETGNYVRRIVPVSDIIG